MNSQIPTLIIFNILRFININGNIIKGKNFKIWEINKWKRGIAIKAFYKSGKVIYEKYFGYKNEEKKLPIDENTIFGIASITKSFVVYQFYN